MLSIKASAGQWGNEPLKNIKALFMEFLTRCARQENLIARHWGCMERLPVGKAARGSSFAPLEKGKQTAGAGYPKNRATLGAVVHENIAMRGHIGQLHWLRREKYNSGDASRLFRPSAAHLPASRAHRQVRRICSDARRLRRRQGAPFFKASRHNVGRMGEIDRRFPISPPL